MKKLSKWILLLLAGGCAAVICACYGVPPSSGSADADVFAPQADAQ